MNVLSADETALLEDLLQDMPDTAVEWEQRFFQSAQCLREFTGKGQGWLPPEMEAIALRLTRSVLFDLYEGFRLGAFCGVSSFPLRSGELSAAQVRLTERLRALLWIEAARAEMFRCFLAGLRHELGRVLGELFQRPLPKSDLRRLFVRWRAQLALALEQAFLAPIDEKNPQHEFGLYGLRILFSTTRTIRSHEFRSLCDLMSWWAEAYPYFPEGEIRDLIGVIAQASLSAEQIGELICRLDAWRDLERYPAERSFAGRREYARAVAQAAGYGKAMTALVMLLAPLFGLHFSVWSLPLLGEDYQRYRQEINRRERLALALADLALQDASLLPALAGEIDALLEREAVVEAGFVLIWALPAFLKHPHRLSLLHETLDRHHIREFDDLWIGHLQNVWLRLSREALETLLNLMRRFPNICWPLQILENVGDCSPETGEWLSQQIRNGEDEPVVTVALTLHRRLSLLQQPVHLLESALRQHVERLLKKDIAVPDHLVRWVLGLRDEGLRRLLLSFARGLASESLRLTFSLSTLLRAMAAEVSHADRPNPIKLAACWLIDPNDELHSGLSLVERLIQAAGMVQRNRFDETVVAWLARVIPSAPSAPTAPEKDETWSSSPIKRGLSVSPRLAAVLNEPIGYRQEFPMRSGASRRLALTRALGRADSPEYALPLLADLFYLAVEMFLAWDRAGGLPRYFPDLSWEANALALEVLKATVQLEPVLPQAVALLEEMLLTQYNMPEGGFSASFSAAVIEQEVLPLLVTGRISPTAIPALVVLLQRDYPVEEKRSQRIWQCALQWLSNASTLNAEQQEIIWNVGYVSPLMLIRSLALLVLGRQRPISRRTWTTVVGLLRTSWLQLYRERAAEIERLSDRNAWFILGPGDVFLLVGVAVALTAEWSSEAGLLSDEEQQTLKQAWQKASSDLNQKLEARLAESTHPLTGKDWSFAKGLALSLCAAVGRSPDDDPDWLTRPADLARGLLPSPGLQTQRGEVKATSSSPMFLENDRFPG